MRTEAIGAVEVGMLGPLDVVDGARRVEIRSAKHPVLLAALALLAGELVTLDGLAEAIWGTPCRPARARSRRRTSPGCASSSAAT